MSSREIMEAKGFSRNDYNGEFRDPVVKRVVQKFRDRSDAGFIKYGTTLDEERTIQEELMDAILYIQTAQEELKDKLDEEKT
jgi:hypothetical protein